MRLEVQAVLCWVLLRYADATDGIVYAPLNVWPYPRNVSFDIAAGPHRLDKPAITYKGCSKAVEVLLNATLHQRAFFRATVRSYDAKPYKHVDAYCPSMFLQARCSTAADCGKEHVCFVDSSRRYNSTHACPPSSPYNAPCGCCVPTSGPPAIPSISVECNSDSVSNIEGYALDVDYRGIILTASTSQGAAYGIATLAQLLRWDTGIGANIIDRVPVVINDFPEFTWRGMMLDTSRHFVPVNQIMDLLNGMYAAKLNTFHWHIVDTPSFPYVSKAFPELASEGSWSGDSESTYSTSDVEAVLQLAKDRFIEVVMEFDTPAHTMSWGKSHPEIMTDCWEWLANENPKVDVDSDDCLAMNPTAPASKQLVSSLLAEVMSLGGNGSRFLHLGGDEVKTGCWNASAEIRDYVTHKYGDLSETSFKTLQRDWTRGLIKDSLVENGKIPVLWQPTTAGPADPVWAPATSGLPNSTVYMAWLSSAVVTAYAKAGSKVVNTQPFYIAGMGSNGWKHVYDADVAPSGLSKDERANVLGGQVCMWGETAGDGNFAERAYQIGMGAAENFWGKVSNPEWVGTWALQDRYNRFLCHLRNFGIVSPPQMPSYCGIGKEQSSFDGHIVV